MAINELDARQVFDRFDELGEADKPRALRMLADYRTQQEEASKPLWPSDVKQAEEKRNRYWSIFENPKVLDQENGLFVAADNAMPGTGDRMRAKEANILFLSERYGQPEEDVRKHYDRYALEYGARNWNEGVTLEPQRFFERAKAEVVKEKVAHELVFGTGETDGLIGTAYTAALMGERRSAKGIASDKDSFKSWLESARTNPGFDPKKEAVYWEAWDKTRQRVESEMGEHGPVIRNAVRMLQAETGAAPASPESDQAFWSRPERYLADLALNDPKAYRHAKQLLVEMAKRASKDDKSGVLGWMQKTGESFGHGAENLLGGALEGTQAGSAWLSETVGNKTGANAIRARNQVSRDLREISQKIIDPVERKDWIDTLVFGGLESAPTMLAAMHPAGRVLLVASYTGNAAGDFEDNGWTGRGAEAAALSVGAWSAAVESASEFLGKIPGVSHALAAMGAKPGSKWLSQMTLNAVGRYPTEIGEEALQDMAAPAVQSILSAFDVVPARSESFSQEWTTWKKEVMPDVALISLPLALLGAGISSRQEIGQAKVDALTHDQSELARMFGDEPAARIAAEPDGARRIEMIRETFSSQTAEERVKRLQLQSELQALQQENEAAAQAEAAAYTVNVTRNAQGWQVRSGDGTTINVDSPEAARRIREGLKQVATHEEAEALVEVMDDWHLATPAGVERSTTLTGDVALSDGQSITFQRDGRITREVTDAKSLANLRAEAAMEARTSGNSDVDVLVNGINSVFVDRVGDAVKGVVQRLELNQSATPQVMSFLHEQLEASWRTGMKTGVFDMAMTQRAAQSIAPILDPRRAKGAEEKALYERLGKVARGEANPTEVRETITEFAVRDALERDRNGRRTGMRAGSISRALDSAIVSASNAADARAFSKIRAFFRSVGAWLRGVMGTVRTIKAAKDAGKLGEDWTGFVDKLLGIEEQVRYDVELAAEIEAITNQDSLTATIPTDEEMEDGMAFSLASRQVHPSAYPASLDETITSTTVGRLKKHPLYEAAKKGGDGAAADAVVNDVLKPAKVEELRGLIAGRDVIWVPVMHRDTGRRANALPMAYADELSYRLGGEVAEDIVKVSGAANTGAAVDVRFANEQKFDGPVTKGALYVVVDDNHTSGDTIASLIDHILTNGGEVIAATALANSQSQNYLKARPQDIAKLLDKAGLNEASFEREFGYPIEAFTGSEAYRLANLVKGRGIEWLRSRIPSKRSQADPLGSSRGSSQASGEAELNFSLSPGARIAEVQAQLDKHLSRDPDARRVLAVDAQKRLQALRDRWESERWTWKGDRIRPLVDKTTARILDHEQAMRQAFRRAELIDAGMLTLTPETLAAYHTGVDALERHPFVFAMLQNNGRLMSRTTALENGKDIGGDYDGAVWIPPAWYARGEGIAPDVMAQNLYEQGLLNDPSPDTLWQALDNVVKSHRVTVEQFAKAVSAVREVEATAIEQARAELEEWRNEQDEMQAKDWSPRASLVRDMKVLDAMLAVMPAEVRGKVGGFVRLAQLGSEKSRLEEIQRRIERLDILLEKYLQKEFREHIKELFEKARPDMKAGKKPKGNMTPDAHRLAMMAEAYSKVPEAEMDGERKKIADAVMEPTADLAALAERVQVLELFGGMDKMNAAGLDAAASWLAGVVKTGKNAWKMINEIRQAGWRGDAALLKNDTGKAGAVPELQNGITAEKTLKREAGGWAYELISFEQLVTSLFGDKSEVGTRLVEWARGATYQRTDAIRAKRQAWQTAMMAIWKGKTWGEVQDALWEHSQVDSGAAMSVNYMAGRAESKVKVPMEIALRVVADPKQAKSLGFSDVEVMELESLIDENDAKLDKNQVENLEITRLSPGSPTAVPLSQLQAVNLTMLARQRNYQDTLSYHGWTPEVIEEIEGKLTSEAKEIRTWLADQYRNGYASINAVFERMFGAPLPQIANYSPGTFEGLLPGQDMTPEGGFGSMGIGGLTPSAVKTRRVHRAPPRLADALVTYWQHEGTMEHFKAFGEFVREARNIMLRPEVRASVQEKAGKAGLAALETWIQVFENDGIRRAAALGNLEKFSSRLQNVVSVAALAWNVGTLAKQSLATLGAAYEMPAGAYIRGFRRLMSGRLEFRAMLQSETIRRRVEAGASPELRQVLAGMMGEHPGKMTRFPRWALQQGMELLGSTDAFFTSASAAIYYDYVLSEAQASGLNETMAKAEAMRKTEAMVARTAQPVELMDRSLYEAKAAANPNQRWLFMFASESRQKAAIYGLAMGRILKGEGTKADYRVALISHVVAPLMLQTITNIISDWRNDDDDELFDMQTWSPARYVKAMLMGPLSGVPLLSGAVNSVLAAATGQPNWDNDPTNPIGEMISKTISTAKGAAKKSEQEPIEKGINTTKAALNVVSAVSALHPAGQPFAWIGGAANVVDQVIDWGDNLGGKDGA